MENTENAEFREVTGIMPPADSPTKIRLYRVKVCKGLWMHWAMYYVRDFNLWTPCVSALYDVLDCSRRRKNDFDSGSDLYHFVSCFSFTKKYKVLISVKDHDSVQEYDNEQEEEIETTKTEEWPSSLRESQAPNLE